MALEKTSTPGIFRYKGKQKTTYTYVVSGPADSKTGKPKQITKGGFPTIKAAKEARAQVVTQLEKGTLIDPTRETVAEYLRGWLERQKPRWRTNTYNQHRSIVETNLIPRIGHHRLDRLRPLDVEQMLSDFLSEGKSANTARQYVDLLDRALQAAVRLELLNRNPCMHVQKPKVPVREPRALDEQELARLIQRLAGERFEIAILLCALTGLRIQEALGLRWRDVNLQTGAVIVRHQLHRRQGEWEFGPTKDTEPRRLQLPDTLWALLRAEKAAQARRKLAGELVNDYDLVVCRATGDPYLSQTLRDDYVRLAKELELSLTNVHALRHTASAHHQRIGTPLNVLAAMLGHSDPGKLTAGVYGAILPGAQREAAQRMERIVQAARGAEPEQDVG